MHFETEFHFFFRAEMFITSIIDTYWRSWARKAESYDSKKNSTRKEKYFKSLQIQGITDNRGTEGIKTRYHNSSTTTFSLEQHIVETTLYPRPCMQQRAYKVVSFCLCTNKSHQPIDAHGEGIWSRGRTTCIIRLQRHNSVQHNSHKVGCIIYRC